MSKPKRLHPITIVVNAIRNIKEVLFPILAFGFFGHKGLSSGWLLILLIVLAFLLLAVASILSWYRYTYQLEEAEIQIEHGVFVRKKRYIPFERIQSLDVSEGILQRLFGLVKIQIETAGGNPGEKAEAVLAAVSKKEAQCIQDAFALTKNHQPVPSETIRDREKPPVYRIQTPQLLLLSVTSGGVGVVLSAVLAFFSQLDDYFSFSKQIVGFEKWAASSMVMISALIFVGFLLAWFIALIGTMLKYAHFTLDKTDHDLLITQGWIEKRQITIPLKRIQAIIINENIVRQMLGYATVYLESAGGSVGSKGSAKVMILPMIKLQQIPEILEPFLSDYHFSLGFHPLPQRSLKRYFLRSWYLVIPLVVVSFVLFKGWGFISLVFLVASTIWAYLKYKDAGFRIEQKQLSLRYRTLVRQTIFMKKNKIQALKFRESYFQRKQKLATVEAFVKSGMGGSGGRLIDVERGASKEIHRWYANR